MAYDLEEQEQIDAFKAWWKQYGTIVILALSVFVVGVAGTRFWQHQRAELNTLAASLYDRAQGAAATNDVKTLKEIAGQLMEKYPDSGYTVRAVLLAAKANESAGDGKSAQAQLQWTLDHAKSAGMKDVARLGLAGQMLDDKRFEEALKLLDAPHGAGFDGLFADRKGDIYVAMGKTPEAQAAYREALEKLDQSGAFRALVQTKLDAVGG